VGPLQLLLQVLLRQQEPQYLPFAAIVCVTATVATVLASAAVAAARQAGVTVAAMVVSVLHLFTNLMAG